MKEKGRKVFPAFLLDWLTFEDVTDWPETSVTNYHYTLFNITEERIYHLQGRETRSHDILCNLQLRERIFECFFLPNFSLNLSLLRKRYN